MSKPSAGALTVPQFQALKGSGRKLTMVTCYDYTSAKILDDERPLARVPVPAGLWGRVPLCSLAECVSLNHG